MSFQYIQLWQIFCCNIVNSRSNRALTIKRCAVRIGVHIGFLYVYIIITYKTAAFTTFHNKAVVLNRFIGILLCKSRIYIRILFHYRDVIR